MNDVAVSIRSLTRSFGPTRAVRGIDLDVSRGSIFGIIGPDGAGKTTMLRLLAGVLLPDSGNVAIDGLDATRPTDALRLRIGYMPQRFSVYGDLSVEENMRFFADLYGVYGPAYESRKQELLEFSRLTKHATKLGRELSGGMQKKLALSCVLFHKPSLLLLDEPTNGVDPVSRRELWSLLYQLLDSGATIIVSTAYMDEAERCGRVALLHEGTILLEDSPSGLMTSPRAPADARTLEDVFVALIAPAGGGP